MSKNIIAEKNSTVLFTTVYLLSFPKQALKLGSKL